MTSQSLECVACVNIFTQEEVTFIEQDVVCHGCIHEVFELAIANQTSYPPKWGSHILTTTTHGHLLSDGLRERYKLKEDEYDCPPVKRVYCTYTGSTQSNNCNTFIGQQTDTPSLKDCRLCESTTCMACRDLVESRPHTCSANPDQTDEEAQAFDGLTKGKHYQTCPSKLCGRKIELRDGCNHVKCPCGTEFCFLCGEKVSRRSNHWSNPPSGCPRFHRLDQSHRYYDPAPGTIPNLFQRMAMRPGSPVEPAMVHATPNEHWTPEQRALHLGLVPNRRNLLQQQQQSADERRAFRARAAEVHRIAEQVEQIQAQQTFDPADPFVHAGDIDQVEFRQINREQHEATRKRLNALTRRLAEMQAELDSFTRGRMYHHSPPPSPPPRVPQSSGPVRSITPAMSRTRSPVAALNDLTLNPPTEGRPTHRRAPDHRDLSVLNTEHDQSGRMSSLVLRQSVEQLNDNRRRLAAATAASQPLDPPLYLQPYQPRYRQDQWTPQQMANVGNGAGFNAVAERDWRRPRFREDAQRPQAPLHRETWDDETAPWAFDLGPWDDDSFLRRR